MSITFESPINDEVVQEISNLFGKAVASDHKTFLIDKMFPIRGEEMKKVANLAKQPVTVEIHGEGEIKELSDGSRYVVTPQGWKKVDG